MLSGPPLGAVQSREMWPGRISRCPVIVTCLLTELAAGVALHGLGLAIAGEVVRSTALVAGGRASAASEAAPEASIPSTGTASSTANSGAWGGAVTSKMTCLAAAVAASAGAGSAQAQSRAVRLDVSEALAVVALLGCPLSVSHSPSV